MKRMLLLTSVVILSFTLFSQEIFIKQSLVVNVEVPVRVFQAGKFIENLTLEDFEIYEDGVPQKIEAVYMIKKKTIEKSEERKRFFPETSRNFFLNFEVSEYSAKLGEAIDYFMQNIILNEDNLVIISPLKTYRLKDNALRIRTKEEIAEELKGILRKDALAGNSEYRNAVQELTALARSLTAGIKPADEEDPNQSGSASGGRSMYNPATPPKELDSFTTPHYIGMEFDELLIHYEGLLQKLEILRKIDQIKLLDFAKFLKNKEGQKYVFLFYQREFIPQIEPKALVENMNRFQENIYVMQTLSRISELSKRVVSINVDHVKEAYADASTAIHFLFISKPPPIIPGVYFEEHTEDIFQSFTEMARATGGFSDSSSDPSSLFRKALDASENYYLLYYSPKNYMSDGKFKEIKVKVKNEGYRVIHRAGYFAN